MADLTSYPAGTAAQDTLLIGTQVNVLQADGTKRNLTRNFSISDVASLINTGFDGGYKVYTALLTQAGAAAPLQQYYKTLQVEQLHGQKQVLVLILLLYQILCLL